MITSVLISVHSVTSVIRSEYFVHFGVVKPRRVVALEVVKINILGECAKLKEVCFLRGSRSLLWWCLCVICNLYLKNTQV